MTVREAISRVRASAKEATRDTVLTKRHVWSMIRTALQLLVHAEFHSVVRQDLYKARRYYPEIVNEDTCFDCSECRIKLKDVLFINSGPLIRSVGSEDDFTSFRVVSPSQYRLKKRLRNNKVKYAYIQEDYLYLQECLPCVLVSAIFETEGESCSILDHTIPIPEYLEDRLIKMSLAELQIFLARPVDVTNNGNPNQ